MPKLLQKNILISSFVSLIISLTAVVCWSFFQVSSYKYICLEFVFSCDV